ncbi:MAG: transposase [Candidatus Margulisiibacteriota bacterium]
MGIKLKTIIGNEWEGFKATSKSEELKRKAVHRNIWKLLNCKTVWMGLQIYQCEDHHDIVRVVPCTCKSRFCPSCGYKANLIWLDQLLKRILPCDYQHLIFTLPYELRDLAKSNRRLIFNLMARTLYRTIKQFINKQKGLGYVPGAAAILHTFGKRLKWHVHYHVLITAGGMKDGKWVNNSYLNENYLKKAWKVKMLAGIRKLFREGKLKNAVGRYPGQTFLQMLSEIYGKNWYVWVDEVRGDGIVAFTYIGRYCKRACVSQKGIVDYKKGKIVVWKELSKKKPPVPDICANRASTNEFLDLLITHIPDTYDHQVHYYGLYSSRNKKILYKQAMRIFKKKITTAKVKSVIASGWNNLMKLFHDVEPLTCPVCKKQLKLTGIIFFNLSNPSDRNILLNYEVKNYELVEKRPDTS